MIASAEWLYHLGGPLALTLGGVGDTPEPQADLVLGPDVLAGETPQVVVPPWQTARNRGAEPTLVSFVVSPAFHMDEFRLAR